MNCMFITYKKIAAYSVGNYNIPTPEYIYKFTFSVKKIDFWEFKFCFRFCFLTFWRTEARLSPRPYFAPKASPEIVTPCPLKARGEHVPHSCTCQAISQAHHTKGTKTWNFLNREDKNKTFSKSRKEKPNHILPHVRVQSSTIYRKVNGTTLWHMLWLIPRTAVSKKALNLLSQHHHKIEDHHWFAWLFFFLPPKVRI